MLVVWSTWTQGRGEHAYRVLVVRSTWTQGRGVHAYRMLVVKSTWTQGRGCLARHGQPVSVKSVGRLAQAMSRLASGESLGKR